MEIVPEIANNVTIQCPFRTRYLRGSFSLHTYVCILLANIPSDRTVIYVIYGAHIRHVPYRTGSSQPDKVTETSLFGSTDGPGKAEQS